MKVQKEKLFVTIDTEMDCDIKWNRPFPPQFLSVTEGINKYLRPIWDKYNINPIYFVSYEILEDEYCCQVLRKEIEKGAVIGAHLHPEYVESNRIGNEMSPAYDFPCFACDREEEKKKLLLLTKKIKDTLGISTVWYRAARFGADIETIEILNELGYLYDSSITPGIDWSKKGGPNHSNGRNAIYVIDSNNYYKEKREGVSTIVEVPITILGKRFGILGKLLPDHWFFYRWLRPTHMFLWEQKSIVRKMIKKDFSSIVIMFHSMEVLINKSPYVRNRFMQKYFLFRLEKTISYAIKKGYASYSKEDDGK